MFVTYYASFLQHLLFFLYCRKIWSSICFHSPSHCRCTILLVLCLCRYVDLRYNNNHKPFMLLIYFDAYNKQHVTFHLSFVGSGGLSFLQFCNLNSFRTKFVLGFSIFLGLSIPQYFNEYTAINGFGPVHTGARWVWLYGYLFTFLLLFTSPCVIFTSL